MGIVQAAGAALLAAMTAVIFRECRPAFASPVRIAGLTLLFSGMLALFLPVAGAIRTFSSEGGSAYGAVILRALGIALLSEFAASFCRDLGENTLGEAVALFGRTEILLLCLSPAAALLDTAKELLKW